MRSKAIRKKIKRILELLQSEIEGVNSQVNTLTESLKVLQHNLPQVMVYISNIATRILLTKDRLIDIAKKWEQHIVDDKIMEIFNFTLPCGKECPINLAEHKNCTLDSDRQIVSLTFDMKAIKPNIAILDADPFILYSRKNNKTTVCSISYIGPKNVIYDKLSDCVVPLPTTSTSYYNLGVIPKFEKCDNLLPDNIIAKYWRANACENKYTIVVEDILQIKHMGEHNYVYCGSFFIHVYDRLIKCLSFVFALPTTVSFSIGNLQYEAKTLQYSGELSFISAFSQRANFHLMPQMHAFDFDNLAKEVKEGIADINTN